MTIQPDAQRTIVQATRNWVDAMIVGLNFCPFAKREVQRQSIAYQVSDAQTSEQALSALTDALQQLEQNGGIETTLLIFPGGFADFDDYLDLVDLANLLIEHAGYRGKFQLATFHPDYCFEGEPLDAASHYTNRSPYPILHILREDSLTRVLKTYSDPERIPLENIDKANQLGVTHLSEILENCIKKAGN